MQILISNIFYNPQMTRGIPPSEDPVKTPHFSTPHHHASHTPTPAPVPPAGRGRAGNGAQEANAGTAPAPAAAAGGALRGRASLPPPQPVTCGGRRAPLPSRPRCPPLPPRRAPSQPGGGAAAARSVVPMEAGAEAEPLLPPRRWRAGRGLWRERGGARSAAKDGECPGGRRRGARGAGAGGALAFPAELGRSREREEREGQEPPGLPRDSAALPGLLPAPPAGTALREPLSLGSAASLAPLLQPQAFLVPYVIVGFFSKVLTSFPRARRLS